MLGSMAQTAHTKKNRLACDSCRRQKRKCDRGTPACSLCEKRNDVCLYDSTFDQRRPEQKDYVAALEARVVLLEGVLRDAGAKDIVGRLGLASNDEGDTSQAAVRVATAPPPITSTQPVPSLEPKQGLESELGFVPSDDAAQALVPIANPNLGETAATTSNKFDLGMGGYVPLVSLDMERKLLAQFWDWQSGHLPFVAPVPFLSAYALYAQVAHRHEPTPSPPPINPSASPSRTDVPGHESIHATPELAQFISPLLLDAMFVIGALFHGNAKLSTQFYTRAESRVMTEASNPRLATVQGVMLMGVTEFGHARAPAAWTLNGIAVALCVRLGMHVDATPLVRDGNMPKMLFETRNFAFWTTYHTDRFYALCLGMHPLLDRRTISTPHHSFLANANVAKPTHPKPDASIAGSSSAPTDKTTMPDVSTIWRSSTTLGTGDAVVQAGWEAIRGFARIMETLFDGIYAFDAPKRSPQEDLELVARNNLTIQRFLDDLPTLLRSTDAIRTKSTVLVHIHLSIHLSTILACRPFLSPRPLSEDAMRLDATTDISQPTHSSHIVRRYRTLAFRIARASALQITSLVRYLPLSSPPVSTPYFIHTACTILLLAPGDTTAMEGVRMGATCLRSMQEMGHWSNIMKDGREGIMELSNRWGVDLELGKKLLGLALRVPRGGRGGNEPGAGEASATGPVSYSNTGFAGAQSRSIRGEVERFSRSSSRAGPNSAAENGTESASITRSSARAVTHNEMAEPSATRGHRHPNSMQEHEGGHSTWVYAQPEYSEGVVPVLDYGYTCPLPQWDCGAAIPEAHCAAVARNSVVQEHTGSQYHHASGLVYADESTNGLPYTLQQQSHTPTLVRLDTQSYGVQHHDSSQTNSNVTVYERQVPLFSAIRQEVYPPQLQRQQQHHQFSSKPQQQIQYQPYFQYPSQKYQAHSPIQHRKPTSQASLPDVTYSLSRTEPQRDPHLPQTRWHQILPPADPIFPFPPDPVACADLAVCFADAGQTTQDLTFLSSSEDPHAGVTRDWPTDVGCSFPVTTADTYAGLGVAGSGVGTGATAGTPSNGGVSDMYAQGAEYDSYGHGHTAVGYAAGQCVDGWMI